MFLCQAWRWLFASRRPDLPQFVAELRAMRVALHHLLAEADTALLALSVVEQQALRRDRRVQAGQRASQVPRVLSHARPDAPVVAQDSQRISAEEAAEDLRVLLYLPKLAQFRQPDDHTVEVDTSRVLLQFRHQVERGGKAAWHLVRVYDRATKRLGEQWVVAPADLLEPGERDTLRTVLQQGTAPDARR
jgi:hypothetical protein